MMPLAPSDFLMTVYFFLCPTVCSQSKRMTDFMLLRATASGCILCKLQSWLKCTKKMWRQFSTLRLPLPAQNLLLIIKNNFFIIFIWSANYVGSCKLVQIFIDLFFCIQFLLISQTVDCHWQAQNPWNFKLQVFSKFLKPLIYWIKEMYKRDGARTHNIGIDIMRFGFLNWKKVNRPTWGSNPRPWD